MSGGDDGVVVRPRRTGVGDAGGDDDCGGDAGGGDDFMTDGGDDDDMRRGREEAGEEGEKDKERN